MVQAGEERLCAQSHKVWTGREGGNGQEGVSARALQPFWPVKSTPKFPLARENSAPSARFGDSLYLPPSKQKVKCTCTNRLHMKACLAEMTLVGLCADAEACRVYDRCRPIPFESIGRCAV